MKDAIRHLDARFKAVRPLLKSARPAKGWVRAVRDALGMTTTQLAHRIGVSQSRIPELEQAEANGNITLKSLERAAEALGCRVVYVLLPEKPLAETVRSMAERAADRQLAAVGQTMKLEDQAVQDARARKEQRARLIEQLMQHPARLWDDP
jgi:predicted DNA-binding mobile mystery protein A